MGVKAGSGKVFGWFANMTSIAGLMTWFGIAVTYVRFYAGMKAQGYDRSKLPFSSRLQPYAAWYVIVSTLVICFVSPITSDRPMAPTSNLRAGLVLRLPGVPERRLETG
jgi:amino acid permease